MINFLEFPQRPETKLSAWYQFKQFLELVPTNVELNKCFFYYNHGFIINKYPVISD